VDFPQGRKQNRDPFYTLFGGSALESLREFFEKGRGPIRRDEAIWLTKRRDPMRRDSFRSIILGLTRRVGIVPKDAGEISDRYGYGGHNTRDIVRFLWHRSKAGRDCAEFFMGHGRRIDPNNCDKI